MALEDEVDLLRRIPLFANLETSRLKLLAFTSERVAYKKGQELFHQGESGDAAYVIIKGAVDILVDTPEGEIAIASRDDNAFVGEIAILCDVPRTATVKAATNLETLKIMKKHFLSLVAEFPEIALEIMRILADRLSNTTNDLTVAREKIIELGG